LVNTQLIEQPRELETILGPVDARGRGPQDAQARPVALEGDVVRDLAAHGEDHTPRVLLLVDVEHPLEAQLVEIEAVADVVIRGDRLRVVVDHDRLAAHALEGQSGAHATPVEFDRRADAIRAGPEDHDLAPARLPARSRLLPPAVPVPERNVVGVAVIGEIEIVRFGRVFGGQGVDLLDRRDDAPLQPRLPDAELARAGEQADLFVREALPLGLDEELAGEGGEFVPRQARLAIHDALDFFQEPGVDLRQVADALNRVALL
jgi:hypothetical protein